MADVSAIPADLEGWGSWGQGLDSSLTGLAKSVNEAVSTFNAAPQSPRFTGTIPFVGDDLAGYAAQNQVVDQWVGKVGQAFESLDHRGVPPQIYRANYQDFRYGRVTVPNSAITKQVGGDPVKEAEDAGNGTKLGMEASQAEASGDTARLKALLAQLAGKSGAFDFAFFQQLGPDGTTKALITISSLQYSDDPKDRALFTTLLSAFDTALGKATNNPNWNSAFTTALFDGNTKAWQSLSSTAAIPGMQLNLLRYGDYSEDFLTQATDSFVYPDPSQPGGQPPPDADLVIMDALARNPDAAYWYLTGTHPTLDGTAPPRVQVFLEMSSLSPGGEDALARLIRAAGTSQASQMDDGESLLTDIAQLTPEIGTGTPAVLRQAIADVIAKHIGVFVPSDPDQPLSDTWTWQDDLFKLAESDGSGKVDDGSVKQIQAAIAAWEQTHGPKTFDSTDDANVKQWRTYLGQVGYLYGLTALPVRQAPYDADKIREGQVDAIATLISFIPFGDFIPGEHAAIEYIVDQAAEKTRDYLKDHVTDSLRTPDGETVQTYYEQAAIMRVSLATQFISTHPKLIPPGLTPEEVVDRYIVPIAEGGNPFPGNADVDQFITDLGKADDTFNQEFNIPTRE